MENKTTVNLLALAMASGGAGYIGYTQLFQDGITLEGLIRAGIVAAVGSVVGVWNNLDYIKNLFTSRTNKEQVFSTPDFRLEDYRCLNHLQLRCAEFNSKEGLEVVAHLNKIIFELNDNVRKVRDEE
jgi:hypothetical protein